MKEDHKDKLIAKLRKKKGRTAAINTMCCECIYDSISIGCGSWRKQVEDCTSINCPLYKFRPCTTNGKPNDEQEEIKHGT